MQIQASQREVIDEFSFLGSWDARYEHLIALGKSLPIIDPKYKTDTYTINGCQSKVWLHARLEDGKIVFTADSDAIITKGIIALLIRVFSGQSPEVIMNANTDFIHEIGLKEHLSPTRANGLLNMIKQIKLYAVALRMQTH